MVKEVRWSKPAVKKFDSIVEYLVNEWGNQVANEFVVKTFDLVHLLKQFPEIGSLQNKDRDIRGLLITKHVRLFYRIKSAHIVLLNFYENKLQS